MQEREIIERILELHPDAEIEVAGADCNFAVRVVVDAFAGMPTLQRQRPILALFKDEIRSGALHALSITAQTRAEHATAAGLVQIGH